MSINKGCIDRIEGDMAVVLFEDSEVACQLDLPVVLLPSGAHEGDWIKLSLEIDHQETANRKKHIEGLIKRLQERNGTT
ncbi:hypothetical protein P9112_002097 [Eukaryota sp. TZLM1-RC]